jgi:hypothetical protein
MFGVLLTECRSEGPFMRSAAATVAFICTSLLAVWMLQNEIHAYSTDIAHHYALIRSLMDWSAGGAPPSVAHLGEMANYPPLAHWMAAILARWTGSGLSAMVFIVAFSVATFYTTMFMLSAKIAWRVAAAALIVTCLYALLRGPVFGRMAVNNYFYAQIVGTSVIPLALLLVARWFNGRIGIAADCLILLVGQLIIATHLTPAAQLYATYCFALLLRTYPDMSLQRLWRLAAFVSVAGISTALNPFASTMMRIGQAGGGAHINLFGEPIAQIVIISIGAYFAIRLALLAGHNRPHAFMIGCLGASTCGFAAVAMILSWLGVGSHYSVDKCMFLTIAVIIFVIPAYIALRRPDLGFASWNGSFAGLLGCCALSLIACRIDLSPSVANLKDVVQFQNGVRDLASTRTGGGYSVVLTSVWPHNIAAAINHGDLRLPQDIIAAETPPADQVAFIYMPPSDPLISDRCVDKQRSNQAAYALNYACFLDSKADR